MEPLAVPLDTKVRTALEARRGDWPRIADKAEVSYSWISKFVNGHIPNPGFTTLQKLDGALQTAPAETK